MGLTAGSMLLDEPVTIRLCGLESCFWTSMNPITEVAPKARVPALEYHRQQCVKDGA